MRTNKLLPLTISIVLIICTKIFAFCSPRFVNPFTDICWGCIFPIKIGGIKIIGSKMPDTPDAVSSPICFCSGPAGIPIPGIMVSFWEPFRIIEVVQDPWCFPSLGMQLSGITRAGRLRGSLSSIRGKTYRPRYFAQAHHIIFPVWAVLDLLVDIPCVESGGWDIAYVTELDPLWQDDIKNLILNPEALVFGNPLLQLACTADAVAASVHLPRNELFWCMGQWGSAYPLTGRLNTANPIMGAAAVASRMIYKLNREYLLCDRNVNPCQCVQTPIWIKSHYRLQIVRPKANTGSAIRIGEPSPLWEAFQAPPTSKGSDNFAFIIFRKVSCCLTIF